jgi:cation diffusion facilitator CzcD-associated flavoprotein CzcO
MRSHLLVGVVAAFRLLDAVSAAPFPGVVIERQEDLHSAYDYVVVGGGTAGLAVANRLSEDDHSESF